MKKKRIVSIGEALRGVENEDWELEMARRAVTYVDGKLNWLRKNKLYGIPWASRHPHGRAFNRGIYIDDEEMGKNSSGFMAQVYDPDKPIATILASTNADSHWESNRALTISELRRAFTFPDDFIFFGKFNTQWKNLGRCVPPLAVYAVANAVRDRLRFIDGRSSPMEIAVKYEPYLMEDVRRVKPNGYNVVSTFSGCGGSSLGYKMAGFKVLAASEFDDQAADSYEANFPETPVVRGDIRQLSGKELLKAAGLKVGMLDVLDGSPPCTSFSTAGVLAKGWGKVRNYSGGHKQRQDDLFWEFARLLDEMKPRAFVGENVTGMVKGVSKGYFNEILALLRSKGYVVGCRMIDCSLLGVPQKRERIFFVGFREDLNIMPTFPRPAGGKVVTVRKALKRGGPRNLAVKTRGQADDEEFDQSIPPSMVKMLRELKPGMSGSDIKRREEWKEIYQSSWWKEVTAGGWFSLRRLVWDKPAYTVQAVHGIAAASSSIHPEEDRRLSIPELRRVCSFPDDFALTGKYADRFDRLGKSVPPFATRAIGNSVRHSLEGA